MRCAGFPSSPSFYSPPLLRLANFSEEQSDAAASRSACHKLRGSKRPVWHSALWSSLLHGTPSCASIKRCFSRSKGRTRWCRCVRRPTKGSTKGAARGKVRLCGPPVPLPLFLLSAWFVFSIAGVLLSAQRASWGQRDVFWKSTVQRGDGGGGGTWLPTSLHEHFYRRSG